MSILAGSCIAASSEGFTLKLAQWARTASRADSGSTSICRCGVFWICCRDSCAGFNLSGVVELSTGLWDCTDVSGAGVNSASSLACSSRANRRSSSVESGPGTLCHFVRGGFCCFLRDRDEGVAGCERSSDSEGSSSSLSDPRSKIYGPTYSPDADGAPNV